MGKGREGGATFAPPDIGWIDFETASMTDIKAGTYRYATEADAIVLAYAIGDASARTIAHDLNPLHWDDMPTEIRAHHARVVRGEAVWAAWNAGFDRAIWNYATLGFPELLPHHVIDVMAQATASGLPPDLAMAARMSGAAKKLESGKKLIALFCTAKATATPDTHPAEWQQFLAYAAADVVAMRSIFKRTRQLPLAEWQEYWAVEAINQRGVGIDLKMVRHAAKLAAEDRVASSADLCELTGGAISSPDHVKRMVEWLLPRLNSEGRKILLEREEEVDEETGEIERCAKYSLTRRKVQRLIALEATLKGYPQAEPILRLLQIRLYGGSKMPAKFKKMLEQNLDGILRGQYVFNGAAQTGRASSKGVQIHNLARDALDYEHDAIELLLGNCDYRTLASQGGSDPVARKLSLLIRPAFVPAEGNVFVWSDWSQIEARVLPWLCDYHIEASRRLEIFREVDADPAKPDIYTRTAAMLSHVELEAVTKPLRQRGKVAELALGFLGGAGALHNMAAGYGLHLTDEEAKDTVDRWRDSNPWAVQYGRHVWDTVQDALTTPGHFLRAGRIGFCYLPAYLGGSLLCQLPSGRWLTYRAIYWEKLDVLDADDKPTGQKRHELTFARGYGRVKLWPGFLLENFTQATAADFLRGTLARLHDNEAADWMPVRLHTHDEILVETAAGDADAAAHELKWAMQRGFDWSEGLPLMSEETISPYYTKQGS